MAGSFSEPVKAQALKACGRCCCICHKFCGIKMECHHIKHASEGGSDDFDNCIPLCLDCHADMKSYDHKHPKGTKYTRKELKAHRDAWYLLVEAGLHLKAIPAPSGIEIIVKVAKREVGWCSMMVRGESEISRMWDSGMFGGHRRQEPRRPRVSGVKSGPPQTVFDVKIINRGADSLQMQDFKLLADDVEIKLAGTSILHNSLETAFKEPLATKRAQVVEVKAHHVAKYLRERGQTAPVDLTFVFIDVCHEEFTHEYGQFDPMAYEDTPDSVSFEEW